MSEQASKLGAFIIKTVPILIILNSFIICIILGIGFTSNDRILILLGMFAIVLLWLFWISVQYQPQRYAPKKAPKMPEIPKLPGRK